jgi:type I restriction enzyme R subunit
VQDFKAADFSVGRGIALREVPLTTGPCDYLLVVDRKALGVIEAKKVGTTLSTVADQSARYANSLPDFLAAGLTGTLPFLYESTGVETFFRDERDPEPRSRRVFTFHRPETLAEWSAETDTLRARLKAMPTAHPLDTNGMRECQIEAITGLEQSFAQDRPRALIHMATGAGKTFTACAFTYRLIKFARARRVLFLVDRSNLGEQARDEFHRYRTPDTGRLFTELYNVQHLTSPHIDDVCRVTICTIRLQPRRSRSRPSTSSSPTSATAPSTTCGARCWSTSTPPHRPHRHAQQADLRLLQPEPGDGIQPRAGRGRRRERQLRRLPHQDRGHRGRQQGGSRLLACRCWTSPPAQGATGSSTTTSSTRPKSWTAACRRPTRSAPSLRTFRDRLADRPLPRPHRVPKTLIFAKDDNHAEDIVGILREEFGKGNEFAQKITYRTTGSKPEENSSRPSAPATHPAHRRHRGHDRHRHRHQAGGSRHLHARRPQPRLFRADERPRPARSTASPPCR